MGGHVPGEGEASGAGWSTEANDLARTHLCQRAVSSNHDRHPTRSIAVGLQPVTARGPSERRGPIDSYFAVVGEVTRLQANAWA